MAEVEAHCIIKRKVQSRREPFIADVFFTDNYGDEHRVRRFDLTIAGHNARRFPPP